MKKLIDEKGRLFGKISVIDLAIFILIIVIAIGAYMKFMVLDQTAFTTEERSVQYTLEIQNVRERWTRNNIRVGDTILSAGTPIGTVTNIFAEPFEVTVSGGGQVWTTIIPERYTVFVEVEGTATDTDGRILVSRTVPLGVGNSPQTFTTRYAVFNAAVREINVDE